MKHMQRHIQKWVRKGIITKEQAEQINELNDNSAHSNWAITGFMMIGFFVFAIGIISIIAANWPEISDSIKLTIDFLVLGMVAIQLVRLHETNSLIAFEGLLFFYMLFVLASIGLIAQIYHLSGNWYDTLFYWSLATLLLASSSRFTLIPLFWSMIFTVSSAAKLAAIFCDIGFYTESQALVAMVIALPFLPSVISASLVSLDMSQRFIAAFRWVAFVAALQAIIYADILINSKQSIEFISLIPSLLLCVILLVYLMIKLPYTLWQKIVIKLGILIYLGMFLIATFETGFSILGAIFSITLYSLSALFFASTQRRGLFNLMTLLVGIRIVAVYINQLYSLATTGFGLMLSGLLIIVMVTIWQRYKGRLLVWAEELQR